MSRELFIQYIKESDARSDETLSKYQIKTHALDRLLSMTDAAFLAARRKVHAGNCRSRSNVKQAQRPTAHFQRGGSARGTANRQYVSGQTD